MKSQAFGIENRFWDSLIKVFKKYDKIYKVIIYGSRAKGNYQKGSDIDLVIVAPELSFEEYLRLYSEIEELDIPYQIDLTKYELLDDNIKAHIDRVGKEVYIRQNFNKVLTF